MGNAQTRRRERRRAKGPLRAVTPCLVLLEDRTLLSPTLTSLSVSATSLVYGQTETLTATVTTNPASGTTPSGGTVSFYDGETVIGYASLEGGKAALSAKALPAGAQILVASYSGSGAFAGSASGVVPVSTITTVAGVASGGPATRQPLNSPVGVAVDSHGNFFFADSDNNLIREVPAGTEVMLTVAGNGVQGDTGDGGPALAAELDQPDGIAVDSSGDIFFSQFSDNVVREVSAATGEITTVAGNGSKGSGGNGGPASSAQLDEPAGLAVDSHGNLFIADSENFVIREVSAATGKISIVAGNGTDAEGDSVGDGEQATAAELYSPVAVAVDSSGDLFIVDDNVVREVSSATGIITTIAGGGFYTNVNFSGPATGAALETPQGLALDSTGDLYIADTYDNLIREMNIASGYMETVAGNGNAGFYGDGLFANLAPTQHAERRRSSILPATFSSLTRTTTAFAKSAQRPIRSARSRATAPQPLPATAGPPRTPS